MLNTNYMFAIGGLNEDTCMNKFVNFNELFLLVKCNHSLFSFQVTEVLKIKLT